MPAMTPTSATALALLVMAAFPVVEGLSAEVMLEEADEADATAELKEELSPLKTDESELSADDAAAAAAEEEEDKADESVLYIVINIQNLNKGIKRCCSRNSSCGRSGCASTDAGRCHDLSRSR